MRPKSGRKDAARRREGEIIKIVERSHKPFVGVLQLINRQAWVDGTRVSRPLRVT